MNEDLLTSADVAAMKDVSARSVARAISAGRLAAVWVQTGNTPAAGHWGITPEAAEAWTPIKDPAKRSPGRPRTKRKYTKRAKPEG